jgi:hypothetical protein
LYSQYNLWTTTGRPSNSFGSVNFAALPPEKRKGFVAENDSLIEFDFDAYHLRLIADSKLQTSLTQNKNSSN